MTSAAQFLRFLLPLLCIGFVIIASLSDIATRTVRNGLVLILALAGLAVAPLTGSLLGALLAASGVFVVAAICWRCGWLGGADAKLLGAATLAIPPGSVLTFMAAVAISGGLLALLYLVALPLAPSRNGPLPKGFLARVVRVEGRRIRRGGPLPYACAIAAGFMFVTL